MNAEATNTRIQIDSVLGHNAVECASIFIPQSMSRNSDAKEHTLNWRVSFRRNGQILTVDYQQGIGHVPGYKVPRTLYDEKQLGKPWETGKFGGPYGRRDLPKPHPADVLYSIVMDDPHEEAFENWAGNFGYSTDSRKAEAIYRACIEQTRSAERVLGRKLLDEIAALLQDY